MTAHTELAPDTILKPELLRLWNTFLNRSDLTIDDDFFESGGDSLLATELLAEIEALAQRTLPPSILFETGTVRRLAERLAQTTNLKREITIRLGCSEKRLFHFFHADVTGLSIRTLAGLLGPERPLLAIALPGADGEPIPDSIEQLAIDRLSLILEAQPHGPYVLGGHCVGALVAFEAARMLVAAGHRVDMVVMIDPLVVSVRRSSRLVLLVLDLINRITGIAQDQRLGARVHTWRKLLYFENRVRNYQTRLKRLQNRTWAERWDVIRRRLKAGLRPSGPSRPPGLNWLKLEGESQVVKRVVALSVEQGRAYDRAFSVYHPSPLGVSVLYFALRYSGRGWRLMSPDIEFLDRPGDHFSHVRGDSAAAIVGRLRARLDALDASSEAVQ
jgi:thioesterase domain-containing protein